MSSATSTSDVRLKPDTDIAAPSSGTSAFKASHFFVLASIIAATGAVIVSRQSTPEHLVLISATIASAGLAAAGFYRVLAPLVSDTATLAGEPLSERARAVLEREKMLAMRALKDLEFDRSMGKVSQSDFDEMAGRLRARALALMKQLDDDKTGYRAIIERELAARLSAHRTDQSAAPAPEAVPPAPLVDAGLCGCGTRNDRDARFCKQCGKKLGGAPSADETAG